MSTAEEKAKAAAEKAKAKAAADKVKAKAKADAEKAKAAAAKAKAKEAADKQKAKEKEAKAKEAEKAKAAKAAEREAAKAAKPAKEPRVALAQVNGVHRPKPGGKTARPWEIADDISRTNRRPAHRYEVLAVAEAEGLNMRMVAWQFQAWRKYNGVTDRSPSRASVEGAQAAPKPPKEPKAPKAPKAPAAPAAPATGKASSKAAKAKEKALARKSSVPDGGVVVIPDATEV